MAEFIYLVVYGKILFYIRVGGRNIGFGLIVIVIRHEKLHSVFGEKFAEFVAKLGGKRLVVRNNESGALHFFYDVCHSKGLARTRNAQKHLRS